MKMKTAITALGLLSLATFGASAAELVNQQQAQHLQSAGTITVSGIGGSPMDYRAQLAEKADAQGARAYRIIEARTGDNWHATAEIYK
ncbi:peroxide/acid stress response protein YhcN [Mixta calida]|uniref:peroxide/acid stress response protein YhcN n=1 Tax=Mixta calida TaxID=665913 RepID=UPI000535AE81|nr:membrane protein [Pantoea sp. PSNIH2]POU49988.1 DUF1471 domain-containing protein [Pantoea sp. PSNIH5]POU70432.1 DUF1471 domain-containing protein [Pantoea sp. PSNIH4]POY68190.1 DUF1471 domain-containing protein [Pantoea sp. PSNIH3]